MKKVFLILAMSSFLGCNSATETSVEATSDSTNVVDSTKVDTTVLVKDTTK